MKLSYIKKQFLDFFRKKDHIILPSSSILPSENDKSSLFTNSGMQQFKDYFNGIQIAKNKKIATSQVCIRAGGKHNDLANVGYTSRHHTMFEMLGNFAFDNVYFKQEAIELAWEFITEVLKIDKNKLYITVHNTDLEAYNIWSKIIDTGKIIKIHTDDNFWSMAKDYGPCGTCTEIFYDYGPSIEGGKPGSIDEDGDRYVEIWNIVFMQYDKKNMTLLDKKGIDTGMGLERITAVIEGKTNNYETSIFKPIIDYIINILSVSDIEENIFSIRIIADHIRTICCMINEGITPANEGRGYILKKIIRRMILHWNNLYGEVDNQKLNSLVSFINSFTFDNTLEQNFKFIVTTIITEVERFDKLLSKGNKTIITKLDLLKKENKTVLDGEFLFKLYDTYGFPIELVVDIIKDTNFELDLSGFENYMNQQKKKSQSTQVFKYNNEIKWGIYDKTIFLGYDNDQCKGKCLDIINDKYIITDKTVFYAESGGQKGDKGKIIFPNGIAYIKHTIKPIKELHVHEIDNIEGSVEKNTEVKLEIDKTSRHGYSIHHTATHLLHSVLRSLYGPQLQQKGSVVSYNKLTFDFNYDKSCDIRKIEVLINKLIAKGQITNTDNTSLEKAKKQGAIGLFDNQYKENVRVVSIGDISKELCGGTHVQNIQELQLFKIISDKAIASGIRRIEAISGIEAINYIQDKLAELGSLKRVLKTDDLQDKVNSMMDNIKQQSKKIDALEDYIMRFPKDINGVILHRVSRFVEQKNMLKSIKKFVKTNKARLIILISDIILIYSNTYISVIKNHLEESKVQYITIGKDILRISSIMSDEIINKIITEVQK